jgi:hypothetical protein
MRKRTAHAIYAVSVYLVDLARRVEALSLRVEFGRGVLASLFYWPAPPEKQMQLFDQPNPAKGARWLVGSEPDTLLRGFGTDHRPAGVVAASISRLEEERAVLTPDSTWTPASEADGDEMVDVAAEVR